MNLGEMIAAYRDEAQDNATPPALSNTTLTGFANEGAREACRRGYQLLDAESDICEIDFDSEAPVVAIDPIILDIRRARTATFVLTPISMSALSDDADGWETEIGEPTHYVPDYQTGAIRLYPSPSRSGTVYLSVRRLPFDDLSADDDIPELRSETHPALVQWMLYRAYSKQDSDMFDPSKASRALAEFEKEFGRKSSSRNETWARAREVASTDPIA